MYRLLVTTLGSIIFLFFAYGSGDSSKQSTLSVGESGVVDNGTNETIAAVSKEAYNKMLDAAIAKDDIGIGQMALAGLIVLLPRGTKVKVIDTTFGTRQVRVQEGEYYGKAFWVAMEHVKRG
jgi:hypothetical protein